MIHLGMTGRVHLCLGGNADRTGPEVICQSASPAPSAPRGSGRPVNSWGRERNPFIRTGAWLIKQVPLGQKAAGVSLLGVPVGARLAGGHTLQHTQRKRRCHSSWTEERTRRNATNAREGMLPFGSIHLFKILTTRREEWVALALAHQRPTVSVNPQPTPSKPTLNSSTN